MGRGFGFSLNFQKFQGELRRLIKWCKTHEKQNDQYYNPSVQIFSYNLISPPHSQLLDLELYSLENFMRLENVILFPLHNTPHLPISPHPKKHSIYCIKKVYKTRLNKTPKSNEFWCLLRLPMLWGLL